MGSKKKTVRNLGYSKLLPQDKDLFIENINKTVAYSKSINSQLIGQSLLRINQYFGAKALEKLDSAVEVKGLLVKFDMQEVYSKLGLSCTMDKPTGVEQSSTVKDRFLYRIGKSTNTCEGGTFERFNVGGTSYYYNNFIELGTGQLQADEYECDPITGTGTLVGQKVVSGIDDDILVLHITNDPGPLETRYVYRIPIGETEVEQTLDSFTFLSATYKANFVKNDDKLLKALNVRMGIPNRTPKTRKKDCDNWDSVNNTCLDTDDSFESTLDNPDYKHIFLTYCVPYKPPYDKVIDDIYGTNGAIKFSFHGITIETGNKIDFGSWTPTSTNYCEGNVAGSNYSFTVDGVRMSFDNPDDGEPQYLIPIEYFLTERTLKEKHKDLGEALTMVVMAEKTVKVKWYQTGFFKIFMWVVAIGLAVTGNPMMLIGMVTSTVITAVFGDKIAMLVGIVMAIYTLGTSLANAAVSTLNILSQVADIASKIMSLYFKNAYDKISGEIEDINEKSKSTREAIDEMTHEMIYIPIGDVIDTIFTSMYDLMYNGAYNIIYDYSHYTKVNHLTIPKKDTNE